MARVPTAADRDVAIVEPLCVQGSFNGETIVTDPPPEELGDHVMRRGVAVVKGVFGSHADELVTLRERVFEWAAGTPALDEPDPLENCHCLQAGVSRHQKTPHVFHSYNFPRPSQPPADPTTLLMRFFEPLTAFKTRLTGNPARLEDFGGGRGLHPQLIQYPAGGGYFG